MDMQRCAWTIVYKQFSLVDEVTCLNCLTKFYFNSNLLHSQDIHSAVYCNFTNQIYHYSGYLDMSEDFKRQLEFALNQGLIVYPKSGPIGYLGYCPRCGTEVQNASQVIKVKNHDIPFLELADHLQKSTYNQSDDNNTQGWLRAKLSAIFVK